MELLAKHSLFASIDASCGLANSQITQCKATEHIYYSTKYEWSYHSILFGLKHSLVMEPWVNVESM